MASDKPEQMSVAEMRTRDQRLKHELAGVGPDVFEVRELSIPDGDSSIRALLYRPTSQHADGVLVWLHGGGWVVGSPERVDPLARALAVASGCVVLSVAYRLAPEHRFPAATDDAMRAVCWASKNAETLGATPGLLAIGGESAGGNIAAAIALMARDRGGVKIDHQLLIYPVTCRDLADTGSRQRYNDGYWLTWAAMEWFWDQYLEHDVDAADPYASPLLADTLSDLPPATIVLAEYDVLHDEGERYAQRLREDGVPVRVWRYEGMIHGFASCGGMIDAAWEALEEAGRSVGELANSRRVAPT